MWHNKQTYQQARISRDARFDGVFFVAVKTTNIYCRPICPAITPKEENVCYFSSAVEAANAGYRPCLRCRPDSAPGSPAWKGVNTTLDRAINLINQGALQTGSLTLLAERLGIGDRYLRQLFVDNLGTSPKKYALYQQCLLAKQLLHDTDLPITEVALASGFNSVRRFNDCFKQQLKLTPSNVRRKKSMGSDLRLKLYYRPPYNWRHLQQFLLQRHIPGLEWVSEHSYGRTFEWQGSVGQFTATHVEQNHCFELKLELDKLVCLQSVLQNVRRILDLNSDVNLIEQHLRSVCGDHLNLEQGLRLPGTWSVFEAGIRAILGQQVSVAAAHKLVSTLVNQLGERLGDKRLFPCPQAIAASDLAFFRMPAARKNTLIGLATHYLNSEAPDEVLAWQKIKGIGPWTINYAQLRGMSAPDILLDGDLGVKKAAQLLPDDFDVTGASPWRSYLTFHLWNQL